ncbi:MAG: hypothetical protein J6J09_06405 [Phocaeicola sp.]|nr:hypothetical protein [Phocaeicola sp.]
MEWLEVPLNLLIVFGTMYLVFELFARRGERKLLIEKMTEIRAEDFGKVISPYLSGMFAGQGKKHSSALRWGMLLAGIGIGLLLGFYMVYYYEPVWSTREIIYTSCVCICGGIALVVSYVIENKCNKN